MIQIKKYFYHFDLLSFDPLSFDPLSFDPMSFDLLSVNPFKFEDKRLTIQLKLSLQGMTTTGYRRGIKLVRGSA